MARRRVTREEANGQEADKPSGQKRPHGVQTRSRPSRSKTSNGKKRRRVPTTLNEVALEVENEMSSPSRNWAKAIPEKAQELEMRKVLREMVVGGIAFPNIAVEMGKRFQYTARQTLYQLNKLRRELLTEHDEARIAYKATAIERLMGHIHGARRDGAWAAVKGLESLLADIQGTKQPVEVQHTVEAHVQHTVQAAVAQLSPEQLVKLADEHRRLEALPPIEATAEPAE